MKRFLIIISLIIIVNQLYSQEIKYFKKDYSDKIIIIQDPSIPNYMEAYRNYNKKNNGILGYRIKIYSQNNAIARTQSQTIKTEFEAQYPDQKAYRKYNDPNFEVFVGDFVTKMEAMAFMSKINSKYSRAFVVKSVINVLKEDE